MRLRWWSWTRGLQRGSWSQGQTAGLHREERAASGTTVHQRHQVEPPALSPLSSTFYTPTLFSERPTWGQTAKPPLLLLSFPNSNFPGQNKFRDAGIWCICMDMHGHLYFVEQRIPFHRSPCVYPCWSSLLRVICCEPVGPEHPGCSAQCYCSARDGLGWAMATLGAGPIPSLMWWRRTLSPTPPPMATEVRRHPGDTLAGVWGHIHTADKTVVGCSQGDGARLSCPLLPTATLRSWEVLHNQQSGQHFPIFISSSHIQMLPILSLRAAWQSPQWNMAMDDDVVTMCFWICGSM